MKWVTSWVFLILGCGRNPNESMQNQENRLNFNIYFEGSSEGGALMHVHLYMYGNT